MIINRGRPTISEGGERVKSTVRNLILAGAVLALAAGCGRDEGADRSGALKVAASIFPLADVARQIGGGDVEVVTLLPPGASPHGFEPQPRQVEQLARCRLLLAVGAGADPWAARAAKASGANIRTLPFADAAGQSAQDGDPHGWLDPVRMKQFTVAVAGAMADLDPNHAAAYAARAKAFAAELDKLDAEHRETLGKLKTKAFVSFHPAFTHLATRYGLQQAALAESHADEGGPERLEHVVEFVRKHKLRVVFAEPQFPAEKLRWLEEQTGASVGRLDPIGNPNVKGYDSYLAMMRSNLKALAAAMSE